MNEQEQIGHFGNEIDKLVDRFREEYDVSYAAIIGTMQLKIHILCDEATKSERESD